MKESCMDMGVCPTNTNVPRTRKIPHHEAKLQRIELHTNVCTDFFYIPEWMKLNFLNQLANLFLVDCIEINIGCILLCRALHFAHREVLLYTSRECHYVGEFVTSPSQCAEKKNAPNTLLYKLTVYYIRDFPNIERMPQRINNCKRNRFLYFF